MYLYLLIKIENKIISVYQHSDIEQMKESQIKEINNSYMIIIHILTLLLK